MTDSQLHTYTHDEHQEDLTPKQQELVERWEAAGFHFGPHDTFEQCVEQVVEWIESMQLMSGEAL